MSRDTEEPLGDPAEDPPAPDAARVPPLVRGADPEDAPEDVEDDVLAEAAARLSWVRARARDCSSWAVRPCAACTCCSPATHRATSAEEGPDVEGEGRLEVGDGVGEEVGEDVGDGVALPVGVAAWDGEGRPPPAPLPSTGAQAVRSVAEAAVAARRSDTTARWAAATACEACRVAPDDEPDELLCPVVEDAGVAVAADVEVETLSLSTAAFAWARVASASVTALVSGRASSVASTCPAATVSPTETFTAETVPVTANTACCWFTCCTEPVRSRCCSTSPRVTVAVR
jgi:hypothetical protein